MIIIVSMSYPESSFDNNNYNNSNSNDICCKCDSSNHLINTSDGHVCEECLDGYIVIHPGVKFSDCDENMKVCVVCNDNLDQICFMNFDNKNVCVDCVKLIVEKVI